MNWTPIPRLVAWLLGGPLHGIAAIAVWAAIAVLGIAWRSRRWLRQWYGGGMALRCLNCGNELQDPGGSLKGKRCSICHSSNLARDGEAPPPSSSAVGAALLGGLIGGAAFGGGGALVGALVAAMLADGKKRAS